MPYVEQERRQGLDPFILHLSQRISSREELVYVLVMLAATEVRSPTLPEVSSVYGDMLVAAGEFQRRVMTPILDTLCGQRGDIFKQPQPPGKPALKSV